ncbi:Hypothetical protein I596_2799 [Dokdonella koreensis DS-123]|uniref:Uncharacterized protein n=1 Tax=Dokdonella koreensis DS-123 TaxID=1300342 RepID=A0A160DWI5_9GAMM|nr:Hypothetical protein I596_2799 [Dokdonella koreensis DS-123]
MPLQGRELTIPLATRFVSGHPHYRPDRRYDDLLAFLFPKAADEIKMLPSAVIAMRRR